MRGPGWGGDEVAVNDGFRHREIDVGAAGLGDVRANGWIGATLFISNDIGSGKDLRGVTHGGAGLVGLWEVTDDFDDARIEAGGMGRTAGRDDDCGGGFGLALIQRAVESDIVTALLRVGLV